jgi:hypothetical protein
VVALVLMSGVWKPGIVFDMAGTPLELQAIVRDALLVGVTLVSLAITPTAVRQANQFSWAPMQEVAKLFIGIFLTMIPVLAMLKAGEQGAFAAVARAVTGPDGQPLPWAYFWFSGRAQLLSRQCSDLPGVLQPGRRRPGSADDHAGHHAGRRLGRLGVHGRQQGSERIDADPAGGACPQLRAVANMAVGYNNFDVPACTARGVLATNTPDVLTETTADFGFALMMATPAA